MSLEIEAINWLACVFTFIGTWMVGSKKANLLRVNQLYLLGSLFFLIYFGIQGMWANVILYIGLGGFAVRGWYHNQYINKGINYRKYKGKSPVISLLELMDDEYDTSKINLVPKDYIGKTRTLTFKRIE